VSARSPDATRQALRCSLALGASAACWGLTSVATKGLLDAVPPLPMLVAQLVGSVAFLWAAVLSTRARVPLDRAALRAMASGLVEPGLAYTVGLVGLSLTTASSASLIGATETPMIVVLSMLFLRERVGARTVVLAVVAGVGVGLLMLPDMRGVGGGSLLGDGLMVASVLLAAIYVTITRRLVAVTAPLPLATLQQTAGLGWAVVALMASRALGWVPGAFEGIPTGALLLAGVTGIFQYALAFWLYLYGLRRVPASRAALFLTLIPVFGVAGAALALGERLTLVQWIGAAVVVGAVQAMVRAERTVEVVAAPAIAEG
jgi:drug/metabolite transporter (DMT)-like permease